MVVKSITARLTHTFLNNTESDVELLVVGDKNRKDN
jgi:uncharacterized cupin superfamily protein